MSFIALFGITHANAQTTPRVDERQQNQQQRINQGVRSGELTRVETKEARQNQRNIQRSERRAKSDGVVTQRERARLNHKQNRASQELKRDKQDAQDRPRAH